MKKLGVIAVLVAAGVWALSQYLVYLPGLIADIVRPVGEFQEVTWQQGPAEAPAGKQPPNIILIVACLLYTSPSPRDQRGSRMPSSA